MNNNQNEFSAPFKVSKSFKIFIVLFSFMGLFFLSYVLSKTGTNLRDIIGIVVGASGGIVLISWMILVSIKKIRNEAGLSEVERLYIDDLEHSKITKVAKQYIFSNMGMGDILRFIVVTGYIFKWAFFGIFAFGTVTVFFRNDTLFSKILMLSLGIIWCPWLENIILKKLNFKIIFIVKLLVSLLIFLSAIIIIG
ncbi:MAG: hypothetical protein PHQ96_05265 [Candidatus Omnitrophica bacterium]|nr:hypothetical protein [Candidatus Omnitrophota bacterium]